jgi:predicted glycosyltransferase
VRVWVDCTAAAHPLVLRPIIERLADRGHEVSVTAREYGQTVGVLERLGIEHRVFGRHADGTAGAKAAAVGTRSAALARWARGQAFDLALAHGSVDIAVVSGLLRIPLVEMQDYEYAGLQRQLAFRVARRVLAPDAIPVAAMRRAGAAPRKLVRYPGLKEDYYLFDFSPDEAVIGELGLHRDRVLAVVRPPPETSAYHAENPLYERVIARLADEPEVQAVVIPRTDRQRESVVGDRRPLIVPTRAIDAQSLIALADLVVGAGGTMNREAVALGTAAWTLFSGRMGAVDLALIESGRLRTVTDPADLELRKRATPTGVQNPRNPDRLVAAVLGAAGSTEYPRGG